MTHGENQPCNNFYSMSWDGGGGEGVGRNVYYKTEMLTATITDDTDKHQHSIPNSMQHIPSLQANSQKMPHILWKFVVD